MEIGPHKDRKTLNRVELNRVELNRLSYKVRPEQAVGTEDVKVKAMNMYKHKKGLRFCKRWP